MFSNTLHLMLHPGTDSIEAAGGLHTFIGRQRKPLITDSGGFQIFSFANRGKDAMPGAGVDTSSYTRPADKESYGAEHSHSELKSSRHDNARLKWSRIDDDVLGPEARPKVFINEEGARFRSYRDGSLVELTPESTVRAQKAIGADIIIPLDDLPAAGTGPDALEASVQRTHRWEARSLLEHVRNPREQAMYGVIHGGTDRRLRAGSVELLSALPFDGFAIGGSLGRDRSEMFEMLAHLMPLVPSHKPNHLLGMGDEESLRRCVSMGVDTFDSSWPTRLGRHGTLLTRGGPLKINQAEHRNAYSPIDPACDGFVNANYSRAHLHHLWRAKEPVVHSLLTLHNIKYMMDLMADLRGKILRDEI